MSRNSHHYKRFEEVKEMDEVPTDLGPLGELWDTWAGVGEKYGLGDRYYANTILLQLVEIASHLQYNEQEEATDEVVDIIGLAVDWLRCLGVTREQLAGTIRHRIVSRYNGNTDSIVKRYMDELGLQTNPYYKQDEAKLDSN